MGTNGGEPTELEILQARLRKEMEKWDQLGIDTGDITSGGGQVRLSLRIDALTQMMVEKGVFTEDEVNTKFCQIALEFYPELRKEMEPMIVEARLAALKRGEIRKH